MDTGMPSKRRLIAVALIAATILVVIVLLTGNQTLSSPSGAVQVTALPPTAAPTSVQSGAVKGSVTTSVKHLSGHTWRFRYTVRATGSSAVGGFQLSGPTAHLFRIVSSGWSFYGNGACGTTGPQGLLIYWSTVQGSPNVIAPGKSATFGFDVNTSGTASISYSLSYAVATPQFGQTNGPAASSLRATGPCK